MSLKAPVFALVDANNFFVSCERIFRPDLAQKPVIVHSSNDGCVVARSNEAKQLGIPMGAPVFKIQHIIQAHQVVQFSGSFELYGNISQRLTETLRQICPRIEIYSVDESFLDISRLPISDYMEWGRSVRDLVWRTIGIPVSIGIAPTKTLAKIATEYAKHDESQGGVTNLTSLDSMFFKSVLLRTPLKNVWGIGRRLAPKLQAEHIINAWDLHQMRPRLAQQLLGIHGRQLVTELHGSCCYSLEPIEKIRKTLERTRTLGQDTNQLHVLESALSSLGARACASLRNQQLLAKQVGFFLTSNRHKPGYRHWFDYTTLGTPSNDTGLIVGQLVEKLRYVFNPDQYYHRAGVLLCDFVTEGSLQIDLLGKVDLSRYYQSKNRMATLDYINQKYYRPLLHFASEDLSEAWRPRKKLQSPRYTSKWNELPEAFTHKL